MRVLDLLRAARIFLSYRELWTKGARATDIKGNIVRPKSSRAAYWDIEGTLELMCVGPIPIRALLLLDKASSDLYGDFRPFKDGSASAVWAHGVHRHDMLDVFAEMPLERVSEVNDKIGYDALMKVLDRAIELAEKDE